MFEYKEANANYWQFCSFRLPCGICSRTMTMCPINEGIEVVTWGVPIAMAKMNEVEE